MLANSPNKKHQNSKASEMEIIESIQQIIFGLNKKNISQSSQTIISIFDYDYPCSFNVVISHFVFICIITTDNDFTIYLNFMNEIQKFQETYKVKSKIFDVFTNFLFFSTLIEKEPNYPLLKLCEYNIIDPKILKAKKSLYFIHYMTKEEIQTMNYRSSRHMSNIEELSKNDWALHKKLIEDGHNPNEIAKVIRNDEIEKLQEITSHSKFNYNRYILPSVYERCGFVNYYGVSLIDYAAFLGQLNVLNIYL